MMFQSSTSMITKFAPLSDNVFISSISLLLFTFL
jgi:hypothetical protein